MVCRSGLSSFRMRHSNSLNAAEDHLLGEDHKTSRWGWLKWVLALILVLLFVYRSTRPVVRLSDEPPPAFYDYNRKWDRQEMRRERQLARAYWNVAVLRIQRYYSPNRPLPVDPSPRFKVSKPGSTGDSDNLADRVHYWYRLRHVWKERDAWVLSYGWNTDWVANSLNAAPNYLPKHVADAFRRIVDLFNDIAQEISVPS